MRGRDANASAEASCSLVPCFCRDFRRFRGFAGKGMIPSKNGSGFKAVKYISNFMYILLYFLNVDLTALKTLKTGHFVMEKGEKAYYTYNNEDR